MERDVRKNPSLLKLDLYCKGLRLDDSCLVEEQGGRKIMRTRAGLGSGLEAILPGGFAHGDYLRPGALARFSPIMEPVREMAERGKPVIGICNGFQMLQEASLLPGAMLRNRTLTYICRYVELRVEHRDSPLTAKADEASASPGNCRRKGRARKDGRRAWVPATEPGRKRTSRRRRRAGRGSARGGRERLNSSMLCRNPG